MAIICDFCNSSANLHICDKCYNIAKRLIEMYEEKAKETIKKKRGRPTKVETTPEVSKKRRGRPKKILETKLEVSKKREGRPKKILEVTPETEISESSEEKDHVLSKCWTCEYGFIGASGKVECADGKEPETCGQK